MENDRQLAIQSVLTGIRPRYWSVLDARHDAFPVMPWDTGYEQAPYEAVPVLGEDEKLHADLAALPYAQRFLR